MVKAVEVVLVGVGETVVVQGVSRDRPLEVVEHGGLIHVDPGVQDWGGGLQGGGFVWERRAKEQNWTGVISHWPPGGPVSE